MFLNNTSLSSIDIAKTFGNVMHIELNENILNTLHNNVSSSSEYKIYDGFGNIFPLSYTLSNTPVPLNSADVSPLNITLNCTTLSCNSISQQFANTTTHNLTANTYKCSNSFETSSLYITHELSLPTSPVTVYTSNKNDKIGNVKYVKACCNAVTGEINNQLNTIKNNANRLVLAYYNNAQYCPKLTFEITPDMIIKPNGELFILILATIDIYIGNGEGWVTLNVDKLENTTTRKIFTGNYFAGFYATGSRSHTTYGEGGRNIVMTVPVGRLTSGIYNVYISTTRPVYYNSMVVLYGDTFTN